MADVVVNFTKTADGHVIEGLRPGIMPVSAEFLTRVMDMSRAGCLFPYRIQYPVDCLDPSIEQYRLTVEFDPAFRPEQW